MEPSFLEDRPPTEDSGKLEFVKSSGEQQNAFPTQDESPQDDAKNEYPAAESKALIPVPQSKEDLGDGEGEGTPGSVGSLAAGSLNRDLVLAKLNQERKHSLIRAWEENVKSKSLNSYNKTAAKISAWERAKKAKAEAKLRTLEEKLEKKRAAYVEKMKNEIASVQMKAEEERALAEARHGEKTLKAEELAAKYRASGRLPKRYPFCFSY